MRRILGCKRNWTMEVEMKEKRILIIGSPGAGKSTLARKLAKKLDLPLVYLDQIWHRKDCTTLSRAEFDERLQTELAKPAWIIDGNYMRTLAMRLQKTDLVIYLDYPTELCLQGIKERIGKPREDLPWQETKLDPGFEAFVKDFPSKKGQIKHDLQEYGRHCRVLVFHSRNEADAFVQSLPDADSENGQERSA